MHLDPEGKEKQLIAELLGSSAGDLIEIGCGDGRLTKDLVERCGSVTALDPELSSLREARVDLSGQVRLLSGSGEELPLVDSCADTVLFSLSLHHQDPVKALAEARRVLRENGRILVLEPVEHSLLSMLFTLLHNESGEYERAEMAIDGSGLKELQSGSVRTKWLFEDFAEMVDHLYSYFEMVPEPEKKQQMAQLLGERTADKPLAVEDITRYWLLREGPGS